MEAGVYIHVPFCTRKCRYCSFYSIPVAEEDGYLGLLRREIASLKPGEFTAPTVYIGGGTPSCMPPSFVPLVLSILRERVEILPGAEITCEANPETFTPRHAALWHRAGVNRLSLGVQSFDDAVLSAMGRRHRSADAVRAAMEASAAGIGNISIDLIYGYPGQSGESVEHSVEQAAALPVSHLSCYCLTVEEGTPLYRDVRAGKLFVDEEAAADQEDRLIAAVTAHGFCRYEISSYAIPGFESRHNLGYWERKPYLGIGAGAHGYLADGAGVFRYFHGDLAAYAREVRGEERFPNRTPLTRKERMFEAIMLSTRMIRGIRLADFYQEFGEDFYCAYPGAKKRIAEGLAREEQGRFFLTERGLEMQNSILMEFME